MTGQAPASDSSEVPSEVADAARLWAGGRRYAEPEYAAWASHFTWVVLRRIVVVGVLAALGVMMAIAARGLLGMLVISTFFALAIVPGVNALTARYGMRRGAAVGIVYLIAAMAVVLLVAVLIPAVVTFAHEAQDSVGAWIADLNQWTTDHFGGPIVDGDATTEQTNAFLAKVAQWGSSVFGLVTSGIGFVVDIFTIAAFTFYIAADFPKLRKAVAGRMTPERQRVFGWITDQSIEQTGGYFYSRLLLMLVNGGLGFAVMVILGLPLVYAVPMALFMGFVSEFIPFIGTYIGAALPILLMLAVQGLVPAVLFLVWVIIYQQVENYWLSPRFSSHTMELNGAVAFGAAIAGGAIAGPMGAFMALPVAALITAIVKNAGRTYTVVIEEPTVPDAHSRWQFWRK